VCTERAREPAHPGARSSHDASGSLLAHLRVEHGNEGCPRRDSRSYPGSDAPVSPGKIRIITAFVDYGNGSESPRFAPLVQFLCSSSDHETASDGGTGPPQLAINGAGRVLQRLPGSDRV
jgi:hypothetical protein